MSRLMSLLYRDFHNVTAYELATFGCSLEALRWHIGGYGLRSKSNHKNFHFAAALWLHSYLKVS